MRAFGAFGAVLFVFCFPVRLQAQNWGAVEGTVLETGSGTSVPGVTIVVRGTDFGTATNNEGGYSMRLPAGWHFLQFSAVGYSARLDSILIRKDRTTRLDIRLSVSTVELDEVTVEDQASPSEAGVYALDPDDVQEIPSPFRSAFQALKVLPGVATNNEISNQYSVRGGGFNENLIFINGFEVFLPFRPRQGEQEGLGLVNPDMTEQITFYTGGFPARYGGKLSSALDVQYRNPRHMIGGSAYLSLLDGGVTLEGATPGNKIGWMFGVRKARARRFFETQELKGNYQPDYTDLQGTLRLNLSSNHYVDAVGIWADHMFLLDPRSRKTYFGTISLSSQSSSNLQSVWVTYDGSSTEEDGYQTGFGGLRLTDKVGENVRIEHDVSYFRTVETELFNISGSTVLYQVDPNSGSSGSNDGHLPIGSARQTDRADNRVAVDTWTAQGRLIYHTRRHAAEAGWTARRLHFSDRIDELSKAAGRSSTGDPVEVLVDSLNDSVSLDATQAGLYVQDALDLLPQPGRLTVTGGVRTDYFSFNDEWTVSPRLAVKFQATGNTTFLASGGLYYQTPTYRELRGEPASGGTIDSSLNRNIRSQRSLQVVAGMEHFFPRKRLYVRSEAYWKSLSNLIAYEIENVRVNYSGRNDARGYVYGLDTQLRGEFVPGLESWVNYSFMIARERFLSEYQTPYAHGYVPRPSDQRHTFSAYIQDYIPGDPTWKIHFRALFGSGLPYTPPVPGTRLGSIVIQEPGPRFSARYWEYKRIDLGVSKNIVLFEKDQKPRVNLQLTAEILNVFDMTNTVAYTWIPGANGIWSRVPTRLTPRTLNARMRIEF